MLGIGLTKFIPYVVYCMWVIALFMAIHRRQDIPLLFLVFLLPFTNILYSVQKLAFGKDFVDILILFVLLGRFLHSSQYKGYILDRTPFNSVLSFLIVYTYVSLWIGSSYYSLDWPVNISDARVQSWKNFIIMPFLFFLAVNIIKDKKRIKWFVWAIVIAIFLMGSYFFKDYRWISKDVFRVAKRWVGTFVYLGANEWGAFHAHFVFIPLSLFLLYKTRIKTKIFLGATVFFSLYSVVFSYSRGAYVATIAGFIFISLIKKRILLIPIIIFLISWHVLLPMAVQQRIESTQDEYGQLDESSEIRLSLWKRGVEVFMSSPVYGTGFSTISLAGLQGSFRDVHNIYVELLAEQGIIGLFLFLSIIFMGFRQGWLLFSKSQDSFFSALGLGFLSCSLSLLITNFFGDRWSYISLGTFYWVLLALVVRSNLIISESKQLRPEDNKLRQLIKESA